MKKFSSLKTIKFVFKQARTKSYAQESVDYNFGLFR